MIARLISDIFNVRDSIAKFSQEYTTIYRFLWVALKTEHQKWRTKKTELMQKDKVGERKILLIDL